MQKSPQKPALLFLFCLLVLLVSLVLPFHVLAYQGGTEVRGTVWIDSNTNGLFEQGENGLKNCTLILETVGSDGNTSEYARTASEKNGVYSFGAVQPGQYRIVISLSGDYRFTLPGLDSAALPASGKASATALFTVPSAGDAEINIGITKASSSITMVAFEDLNANGGRMNTEPLMRNVHIELQYEADGVVYTVASADTNREGEARFSALSPATYRIAVTAPEGYGFGPLGQKENLWYNCIPASGSSVGVSGAIELPAKGKAALAIGLVKTGAVTGTVWFDANASGAPDGSEGGLEGFPVTLTSAAMGIEATAYTDQMGVYRFSSLPAGEYLLTVTLSDEYMFAAGSSVFSDPSQRSASTAVAVSTGSAVTVDPIGVMPDTAVAVTVFLDQNANGYLDNGEPLMPGVSIGLTSGNQVMGALTDSMGSCIFRGLTSSSSSLSCALPEGYIFTSDDGDSLLSYSIGGNSAETVISTPPGTTGTFLIGATLPSRISGTLYEDLSLSGRLDEASVLLPGFRVILIGAAGQPLAETFTGSDGKYLFDGLPGGQYRVRFIFNDPYIASTASADSVSNSISVQNMDYGETAVFDLAPGADAVRNGALYQAGSVEGYVLLNPAYDSLATNAGGLSGVKVTLLDPQGVQVSDHLTDTTDDRGYFYIKGVDPGTYTLYYAFPPASVMVSPVLGASQWTSEAVEIPQGALITMPDTGAVLTSEFSGKVQPAPRSENTALCDAEIELRSSTFGTVLTRRCDENGVYRFSGLLPDTYEVSVTLEDGYLITGSGRDFVPMSASPVSKSTVEIAMGSDWSGSDVYISLPSAFELRLYFDRDNSLSRDDKNDTPADGRALTLTGPGGDMALATDAEGQLTAEGLYPGSYLLSIPLAGDEIVQGEPETAGKAELRFTLTDGKTETREIALLVLGSIKGEVWNLDGNTDHIGGVPVTLLLHGEKVAGTESSADGSFLFDRLYPGVYTLSAQLPENYIFARRQDAKERGSVILNTGAAEIRLAMGDKLVRQDIGIGAVGGIGDLAWLDENRNGLQDIGEKGIPGLLIELYQYGELIASTNTDPYGRYAFRDLYPGTYRMTVTVPEELNSTRHRTDYPLVNSILPERTDPIIEVEEVIIPSGAYDMNCDLGFVLKTEGVYPASMKDIPERNWTPYADR